MFNCVDIDYARPVSKPRFTKGYVAALVCLVTKAVHLELIFDLTSSAFIATLQRFIGCLGIPSKHWSDHGTNFIRAEQEIANTLQNEEALGK